MSTGTGRLPMGCKQLKVCKTCSTSQYKSKIIPGMVKYFCGDEDTYGVDGFHSCENWSERQCTLCVRENEEADTFPCVICAELAEKPYFERRVLDNEC